MDAPKMFAPAYYAAAEPAAIVRDHPFALLVTTGEAGLHATLAPICFERDGDEAVLVGHLARRNPHAAALASGQPALAVFTGPHAYVSSRWYEEKPEVPTWNYLAAQARGTLEPIDELEAAREVLRRTVEVAERGAAEPWTLEQAEPGRVDVLLPKIRAFRIVLQSLDGATKLSQTHPPGDRLRVIDGLLARGRGGDVEIARLMAGLGLG